MMIALCFLVLPFTYFYAEETLESEDALDFFDNDMSDEEELESDQSTKASKTKKNKSGSGELF